MKKSIIFIATLLLSIGITYGSGIVHGKISDKTSGEYLTGVNIQLLNSKTGTSSTQGGSYTIELQAGTFQIEFSYLGYENILRTVHIKEGRDIEMNIQLSSTALSMEELVVTASRIPEFMSEIPGRVELITTKEIKADAAKTADELLTQTSGVIVDRSQGIFGKSVVSIRGIVGGEQGRILVLQNGTPINKSDGGSVNWNRINVNNIQKVEIFKGPGSSIYGSNAMGGVINFITKKNTEKGIHGFVSTDYGTFNTFSQNFSIGGRANEGDKSFYWNLSGNNRTSDGHINIPEEDRDEYTIASDLKETGLSAIVGYDFNKNSNIEIEYNYYDDERGQGEKIQEEQIWEHDTHFLQGKWNGTNGIFTWNLSGFYQHEDYLTVRESIKKGEYSNWHVDSKRDDKGLFAHGVLEFYKNRLSFGADLKVGEVDGADVYQTSTDIVRNIGTMNNFAIYVQDKYSVTEALKLTAGLRFDMVNFHDGEFTIEGMTGVTSFMEDFTGNLPEYDWSEFTPKAAAHYEFSNNVNTYFAWSKGFRTPTLDDLCRSGFISGGFKEANPNLGPETVNSFEWGLNINASPKLKIMPGIYFMKGDDFMYYLATGETIFGGKKKVVKKENITEVNLMGLDIDFKYRWNDNFNIYANYTYTKSEIKKFEDKPELEGKSLTYTPENMVNAGFSYESDIANFSLNFHYQDKRYSDDENEESYAAYSTVDAKIWKEFNFENKVFRSLNVSIDANNLMDKTYMTSHDQISLGRFVTGGITLFF